MISITTEQLADADRLAAEAEEGRADAERAFATSRCSPAAEQVLADAHLAATHAAARARMLRADYDGQRAAREARATAEKAAAKTMAATAKKLGASRETAVQAVTTAEAAMREALTAIAAHDAGVRAASAELKAAGLTADDGEEMGGSLGGVLHLAGETWHPIDAASVLAFSLAGAVAAIHPRHPLARTPRLLGGAGAAAGRAALLGNDTSSR